MQNEVTPILLVHATAGGIMLLSGLVAMMARKADNYHRISGKVYFYSTFIVGVTGFIIAIQKSNLFLTGTSIFVLYMVTTAYRSLYLKQLYKVKKAELIDWLMLVFATGASIFLLLFGGYALYKGNISGLVPLTFGLLSSRFAYQDIKKFVTGPDDKKHWLYGHINGMLGSYIAGITAFLAVNGGHFTHRFLWPMWLAPTVIGIPLINFWRRKYAGKPADLKQKLGLRIKTAEV